MKTVKDGLGKMWKCCHRITCTLFQESKMLIGKQTQLAFLHCIWIIIKRVYSLISTTSMNRINQTKHVTFAILCFVLPLGVPFFGIFVDCNASDIDGKRGKQT